MRDPALGWRLDRNLSGALADAIDVTYKTAVNPIYAEHFREFL
jgi:hypothetical protein